MFNWGKFTSHSGVDLDWKIECDDLTDSDWDCLARLYVKTSGRKFYYVRGVHMGGNRFALALQQYRDISCPVGLIADDVLTTGDSLRETIDVVQSRYGVRPYGVVAFARSYGINLPEGVVALFRCNFLD